MKKDRQPTSSLNDVIHDMEFEKLKQNISNKHKKMVKEIDGKLDKIFDDFLNEVNKLSLNNFEVEKLFDDGCNGKRSFKDDNQNKDKEEKTIDKFKPRLTLPEKNFQARNALLTDLFEVKHIKTIYHIFIVIFNLLLLNVFISDFADTGNINIGLQPILTGFGGFDSALLIWSAMQMTIFAIYPVFKGWSYATKTFFPKSGFFTKLWHTFGVVGVISYQIAFVVIFTKAVVYCDMAMASSVAVLMELVRFLMKSHAFIRTNVPRVLNSKNKLKVDDRGWEQDDEIPTSNGKIHKTSRNGGPGVNDRRLFPSFGQYTYFLFAPTLVYRDEYPRTKQIRWRVVAKNYMEVIAVIFIYGLISERIMYPVFKDFGSEHYETGVKELLASVFNSMLPGLLCFLCGFYCILHSWMNAAAELLRFADRKFYSDWWNSSNFSVYYRTWNIIVHDWLYLYVYKDLYEHITGRNRVLSQLLVFSLSAIFHEYILGFTFKFCYPILFVLFQGAGVFLVFVTKKEHKSMGNIFMLMSLAMGMGIILSLYHMEFYARKNCDYDKNDFYNYFIPISWSCNGLKFSDNWEMKIKF